MAIHWVGKIFKKNEKRDPNEWFYMMWTLKQMNINEIDKWGHDKDTLFVMKSYKVFKRREKKLVLKSLYVVSALIQCDLHELEHL